MTAATPRVLVTGFEAFAGMASNPTEQLVGDPDGLRTDGVEIVPVLLPVSFAGALERVRSALDEHRPDAVLGLGLAAGRPVMTPERIGVNVAHVEPAVGGRDTDGGHDRADNDGAAPRHRPVDPGAPDALLATLPPDLLVAALREAAVPAAVSESAGTYVCNTVLFGVLAHLRATRRGHVPAGFVHVPATPDLAVVDPSLPSMDAALLRHGVRACLEATASFLSHPRPVPTRENASDPSDMV
ncbi:hypothetical protein KLP28_07620 [Nocardioidaceae bacterium]|nr:hypothetical protein KLP28_07620 [Nocardioidaceae bacterium]